MGDHRAYEDEYNSLAAEAASLRQHSLQTLDRINAEIAALVAKGGPLYCTKMSANVTALLQLIKTDLHLSGDMCAKNLEACINGYISGLNHYDEAT